MAIGSVVRPAGRQDRGEPTLGGDGSGKRRRDWQGEIDHGGNEEFGTQCEWSEPGTAGPRDPRLPWWIPDPAEGGVAVELQEAIAQSILPAYQQLVLEAPSVMERVAGEMLIQALWADCLRQLKLKHNFAKAISDDPFESAGVVGEATALLGTKIKAGNFLVKVQEVRLKQEAAARNAVETRRRAMEDYRTQFASQTAACAGSANRGEAPGVEERGGTEGVGAEIEADTAAVAEESRGLTKRDRLKPGLQRRGLLRKNRGALTKRGRLKPGLQLRGPLRKNRRALTKGGRLKPGLQRRGPLRKNRGALTKAGRLKPGLQRRGLLRKNRGALTKRGRLKPGLQRRGLLRKNRGALTKRERVYQERSHSHERHKPGGPESRPTAAGRSGV